MFAALSKHCVLRNRFFLVRNRPWMRLVTELESLFRKGSWKRLNHIKVLQSNVVHFKTKSYTLMCSPYNLSKGRTKTTLIPWRASFPASSGLISIGSVWYSGVLYTKVLASSQNCPSNSSNHSKACLTKEKFLNFKILLYAFIRQNLI